MSRESRKIQQSTFDDVVRENVLDLEMSPEEAIRDAQEQFKSQGVSLNGILTQPTIKVTESGIIITHRIVDSITELKRLTTEFSSKNEKFSEEIKENLKIIEEECKQDAARRSLAATSNAFPILMNLWKQVEEKENLLLLSDTLASLVNGQPDLFDESSFITILESFRNHLDDESLCVGLLLIFHVACIKHEANRQLLVDKDVLTSLMQCMKNHRTCPRVIHKACAVLRSLVLDDDIRVEYGRAYEHAKAIVIQHEGLVLLLQLLRELSNNVNLASEIVLTLSRLMVRHEFCKEMADAGALRNLCKALIDYIDDSNFVRSVLLLLKALAGNDHVKNEIVKEEGHTLIIDSANKHVQKSSVCEAACAALATLSLRTPPHCTAIMEAGGASLIVQAMTIHSQESGVQRQACMAIRNLVARTREHGSIFLELGAEQLIRGAREQHSCIEDEAKAALRDLGCSVELKEYWTGKKGGLEA